MFGFAASPMRRKKEELYAAIYQNDYWQNELSPIVGELIDRDRIEVTILKATPRSLMQ